MNTAINAYAPATAEATLPTRAEALAHVKALITQSLREGFKEGRMVTYAELDRLVGGNVRRTYGASLRSARATVLEEYGYLFKPKTGVGLVPVSDSEKLATVGTAARKKIEAETGRWRQKHDSISPVSLDSSKKVEDYTRECLRLSFQEEVNSGKPALKIEAAIESVGEKQELTNEQLKRILHAANEEMRNLG